MLPFSTHTPSDGPPLRLPLFGVLGLLVGVSLAGSASAQSRPPGTVAPLTTAARSALVVGPEGASPPLREPFQEDAPFALPVPMEELPIVLTGEIAAGGTFVLSPGTFCPESASCILGDGFGIVGSLLWRWPRGWVAGLGASFDYLDGDGVHEITTLASLEFTARYLFLRGNRLHPWVGGAIGALTMMDSFNPVTGGAKAELLVGLELELTPYVAVTLTSVWRLLMMGEFQSRADGVERGEPFGVSGVTGVRLGLVLMPDAR